MNDVKSNPWVRRVTISPGSISVLKSARHDRPEGWSRLQVLACGVCGTDLHLLHGMTLPTGAEYPVYPGHEVAARILETDPDAELPPGATVILHPLLPCGGCNPCKTGRENQCASSEMLGIHRAGGLSDELIWRSDRLVAVDN